MKSFKDMINEGGEMYPADDMTMKEIKIACYSAQNILDRLENGAMLQRWQISAIVKAKEELASVYTSMSADEEGEEDWDDDWGDEEESVYVGYEYPSMYGESKLDEEKHPIVKEYEDLKKHDINTLRGMVKQHNRISDTSEIRTKDHAITKILRHKHGNKKVAQAFGLDEEAELEENYTVHVDDGSKYGDAPHKKDVEHVMAGAKMHRGEFDGMSDKGAYYKFKNRSDASSFVNHVRKAPHRTVDATLDESVNLGEGILKSYHSIANKPWSETVKASKNKAGEYKQIAKGKDFTVWTGYTGSLKQQPHYVVKDDKIVGSGMTMNAALKDAKLKDSDLTARSKFNAGSILNKGMKEEAQLDEVSQETKDRYAKKAHADYTSAERRYAKAVYRNGGKHYFDPDTPEMEKDAKRMKKRQKGLNIAYKDVKEEADFKVSIEGLPKMFVKAKSEGDAKTKLRKVVKNPDLIKDVSRVNPSDVKRSFRDFLSGKKEDELSESPAEMKKAPLDVAKVYNKKGPSWVVRRGVTGLKAFDNEADARAHRDHLKRQEEERE